MIWRWLVAATWLVLGLGLCAGGDGADLARRIAVRRGVCIVLGDTGGPASLALARDTELVVYAQLAQHEDAQRVCRAVDQAGLYGTRIYVGTGTYARLHLADNLADAVVALGAGLKLDEHEVLRVLRPGGRALIGQKEIVKPVPAGSDDWSHPYYRPHNNMLSRDQLIRPPYLTQFLAGPHYAPAPQAYVSAGGRLFCAFGNVAFHQRSEPFLNTLLCVNAYNGVLLWKRDLPCGAMVDRNTMIATPETLYLADDKSCKLIDSATGEVRDELVVPAQLAGGTFWKWMGLENGVLYAMVGASEGQDETKRWRRRAHGWAWDNVSSGFGRERYSWGLGRTLLAIDPETKKTRWHHQEERPIDSRAICLRDGRLYLFSPPTGEPTPDAGAPGPYLVCLDTEAGTEVWRVTREDSVGGEVNLFEAVGEFGKRAGSPNSGWHSARYLRCANDMLYFAGPPIKNLVAASAKDGEVRWVKRDPFGFQIIVREDAVYAFAGQGDRKFKWAPRTGHRYDPRTGEELGDLPGRRACVPATGTQHSVFTRAFGGTLRYDTAQQEATYINAVRPSCFGGVVVANGHLYWGPWQCDCSLLIFGLLANAPAGDHEFGRKATETERLQVAKAGPPAADLVTSEKDWPTLRGDNRRTGKTRVVIPGKAEQAWEWKPAGALRPTAPVAAGGLVFFSGSDGIVRAIEAEAGSVRWQAYVGGAVNYPPSIWQGRVYVGSGDGWVYALDAGTGRLLWRFRAAPVERRIMVHGKLLSTWPAASGVLVQDGVAYVAAGTFHYNGTHLYALDAVTGQIKWQNNTSGDVDAGTAIGRVGVSVQGHLLANQKTLYLAGGLFYPAACFDLASGRLLNKPSRRRPGMYGPGASELYLTAQGVGVTGKRLYQHPDYIGYKGGWGGDAWNMPEFSVPLEGSRRLAAWGASQSTHIACVDGVRYYRPPKIRKGKDEGIIWECRCDFAALAVGPNAVVATTSRPRFTSRVEEARLVALSLTDGKLLWEHTLPAAPLRWGLAVDRSGRVIVALQDGRVLCFAAGMPK